MKINHVLLYVSFPLYTLTPSTCAYAQHENNIWKFGPRVGLDFSTGSPVIGTSSMTAYEGCATVCDAAGHLLFYSNCDTVWDKNNNVMPNGTGLLTGYHGFATQGASIVKSLQNPNQYYLFTMETLGQAGINDLHGGHLRYSVIDMTLNGGFGDIVPGQKDILIDSNMSEKMTVTTGNNCNYWLLTHNSTNAIFHAYKIDATGVHLTPVISNTGAGMPTTIPFPYMQGEMKVSPDRSMIALANNEGIVLELANFDATTGIVSNRMTIDSANWIWGVEFSPNSKQLYASDDDALYQYDLSLLPNVAAVRNSKQVINYGNYWGLRAGEDNKIYIAAFYFSGAVFGSSVCCINAPDKPGQACNVVNDIIIVPSNIGTDFLEFGNPVAILPADTSYKVTDTTVCKITAIINAPAGYSAYLWSDGSTQQSNVFQVPDTKWVYAFNNCDLLIDTFRVTSKASDTTYAHTDTALCFTSVLTLTATPGYEQYLWNDGSSQQTDIVHQTSLNWCIANKECHFQIDTFNVVLTNFSASLGNDTSICAGDTIVYHFSIPEAQYMWSNASTDSSFDITGPDTYSVTIRDNSCVASDTVTIINKILQVSLGDDTTLCNNKQLPLACNIDGAYLWQDNSTNNAYTVSSPGAYWVQVTEGRCVASDTMRVIYEVCDCQAMVPNAFTPNGDGKNDLFGPIINCNISSYHLMIFNRWGQQVFESFNINDKWNGSFKGIPAPIGDYFYSLTFSGPKLNIYNDTGDITLIR